MTKPEENKQIVYLTDHGKLGVLKGTRGWDFHVEKYHIKRWWYADEVIETMIISTYQKTLPREIILGTNPTTGGQLL